jgi:hypothetical protein
MLSPELERLLSFSGGLDSRTGLEERVGRFKVRLEYSDGDEIVFKRIV